MGMYTRLSSFCTSMTAQTILPHARQLNQIQSNVILEIKAGESHLQSPVADSDDCRRITFAVCNRLFLRHDIHPQTSSRLSILMGKAYILVLINVPHRLVLFLLLHFVVSLHKAPFGPKISGLPVFGFRSKKVG